MSNDYLQETVEHFRPLFPDPAHRLPVNAATVDQSSMSRVLSEFTRSLTGTFSVTSVLERLSRAAVDLLPVDGTGVMLIESGQTRYVAASSEATETAERAQSKENQGPSRTSYAEAARIVVEDLARATSWPGYCAATVAAGFRAVVAIPLVGRDTVWGVLDLYRQEPGPFDWTVLAAAQALADVATSHVLMADDRERAASALGEMSYRALHDPLTGLANRALFFDRLDHALVARRRSRGPVVVMFVDLNGFKDVNDTYGHVAGDLLLQEVTRRFGSVVRAEDTLARLGGDEFGVLSSSFCSAGGPAGVTATATMVARRLVDSLADPVEVLGEQVYVSASVGVALAGPDQESAQELLHAADAAMYRSKHQVPSTVQVARSDLDHRDTHSRTRLTSELRRAVAQTPGGPHDQFRVLYQPVVALHAGDGPRPRRQLEALLRWDHPTRGRLEPADFLRIAEDTGMIIGIGARVLRCACVLAREWQDEEFDSSVAVNVSAAELRSPGFVDSVRATIRTTGIDPSWLRLEITEHSLLESGEAIDAATAGLRALGVGLSLDDFGTGFSSLSHLERFPVDAVKIDRSFVARLGDGTGAGIVGGVLALARSLGLEAVAEGVESTSQLAQLQRLGCDHGQGYLLGRPATRAAILAGAYPAAQY